MTDAAANIKNLELQVARLNQKLQEQLDLDRGNKLEHQLSEAQNNIEYQTKERYRLQMTVQDLQRKLIDKEASNINKNNSKYNYSPNEHILLGEDVAAMYDGEREKEMERMYIRAKRDKEKSVRLLIELIGKDQIADFLDDNTGGVDLLDRIYEGVMTRHIVIETPPQFNTTITSPAAVRSMSTSSSKINNNNHEQHDEKQFERLSISAKSDTVSPFVTPTKTQKVQTPPRNNISTDTNRYTPSNKVITSPKKRTTSTPAKN